MGSSRGQGMLLSEVCSCSAERRTRRPIIEIFKLPAVSRIRVRWRPPVSVPYTSLSPGLRLDTFGMKLRHRRWSGASGIRRSKAAVRGWISRCAKRPSWYQRTRPVDRLSEERDWHVGVSQSRRIATIRTPGHSDPTVDYSVECNRSKRVSITGPRCKPTVDLQGRTVPLYLNHDRPGENNPQ